VPGIRAGSATERWKLKGGDGPEARRRENDQSVEHPVRALHPHLTVREIGHHAAIG